MSMEALRWALPLKLTGPKKAVLVVLANAANDSAKCWPSIGLLALHSGFKGRTVQLALGQLAALNVITVEQSAGRYASRYALNLEFHNGMIPPSEGSKGTPLAHLNGASHAGLEPLNPALDAGIPCTTCRVEPCICCGVTPPQPRMSCGVTPHHMHPNPNRTLKQERKEGREGARARKRARPRAAIPPDWQPSEDGRKFATDRNADRPDVLSKFRDHHLARGSTMADWEAAWRLWCINEARFADRPRPAPRRNGFLELIERDGFEHDESDSTAPENDVTRYLRLNGGGLYGAH